MALFKPLIWVAMLAIAGCGQQAKPFDWAGYTPDWQRYRATAAPSPNVTGLSDNYRARDPSRVTFADLKAESDRSLAGRLLGVIGTRIAYVDRHPDRWQYYDGDSSPAESIDLYTHPYALGSQFGLCGADHYSIEFGDDGTVASIKQNKRYGIEGPILQKSDFDWDHYYDEMCASVPASNAPAYFPSPDLLIAHHGAQLLVTASSLASSSKSLPFRLKCRTYRGDRCWDDPRQYLGRLRLHQIDEITLENCPNIGPDHSLCFTITADQHEEGPFPKYVTVTGSTYMNIFKLTSVEILEGFTIS